MRRKFDITVKYFDFVFGVPNEIESKKVLLSCKIPAQDVKQAICLYFLQSSSILSEKDVTLNTFTIPIYLQVQRRILEVHEYVKTVDSNTQPRFKRVAVYHPPMFLKYFT